MGFEAGTVGTAIDQRLRLAFSAAAPVDAATALGVAHCRAVVSEPGPFRRDHWKALAKVGQQLLAAIKVTVADLDLDARGEPMLRSDEDEQRLARMLLAAAWYALSYRVPIAFIDTPLFQAAIQHPRRFTLKSLLEVPHRDLVADVQAQLDLAEASPLAALRARSTSGRCSPGPVFDGSADVTADADLIVDGVLIDFKSTRRVHDFPLVTMHQLLGYVLMDYSDQYEIDEVGMYLTRAGALVTWPLEDYLALLGTRRRDLGELRTAFAALLGYRGCRADNDPLPEQQFGVDQLLVDLAPVIPDECCRVCGVPLAQNMFRSNARKYCSRFCSGRAHTLRRHGWLD
ncbi:hypothetical protein ACIA8G_21535 [Lentzea sp. NPDC051213]|uniref:hypothetical protein n=1 Tax=Lentzea sp. NPDC051213 TaxID=3364126 RepID=UPI0037881BD0